MHAVEEVGAPENIERAVTLDVSITYRAAG